MTTKEIIAANMVDRRNIWEFSQADLAEETGVSAEIIAALENKEYDAPLSILEKIAEGLRCPLNVLLEPRLNETSLFESVDELRQWLEENDYEDTIVIEGPYTYLGAIIGISEDGRLIYNYDKMIGWLIEEEGFDADDAQDFICNDTLVALPYMEKEGKAPVVVFDINK